MQKVMIDINQSGQRLDKFLHRFLPEAQRSFLYKMLRKKNITLNGRKAEGGEMLAPGDEVCFFFAEETFWKFRGKPPGEEGGGGMPPGQTEACAQYRRAFAQLPPSPVLYEDGDVLILNKSPGVLTQKAGKEDLSLNEYMVGYLLEKGRITEDGLRAFHPSVCNRLDRNTSGIVLCGKSLKGSQALGAMMGGHTLRKLYHTVTLGVLREDLLLEGRLEKDSAGNRVRVSPGPRVLPETSGKLPGDYIRTAYRPLSSRDGYTLLEAELFTGKSHQIRAQLASIGHPVVGDYKYGSRKDNDPLKAAYGLEHQLLHAHEVVFPEDCTLEGLRGRSVKAPYPGQFGQIVKALGLAGGAG